MCLPVAVRSLLSGLREKANVCVFGSFDTQAPNSKDIKIKPDSQAPGGYFFWVTSADIRRTEGKRKNSVVSSQRPAQGRGRSQDV